MLKLAVNELTTFRWTLEQDVANYTALGIPAIGVWRHKLSDAGEDGIDLIHDSGLEVSSLLWAGGFTGSDGRSHQESIDDGVDAIRQAALLQASCLVVYTGGRGGHTRKHAHRLSLNALRNLAEVAEDWGVVLAVEPMHPGCGQEWTFLSQLDEAIALIDAVGNNSLRVVFDTYHLAHSRAALEMIPRVVDRIGLVHLGDARHEPQGEQDRCPLGDGQLPLAEVMACLQDANYTGYYEIELLGQEIEILNYADILRQSLQAIHDLPKVTQ